MPSPVPYDRITDALSPLDAWSMLGRAAYEYALVTPSHHSAVLTHKQETITTIIHWAARSLGLQQYPRGSFYTRTEMRMMQLLLEQETLRATAERILSPSLYEPTP